MTRVLIAIAMMALGVQAHAIDWICSTSASPRVAIAAADLPEGSTASGAATGSLRQSGSRISRHSIGRLEIQQAYSGQPVLLGSTWLLAIMLPANHPDSRAAFAQLGLSAEAAERMANNSGLVDRGIRIAQTPEAMISRVASNPPAVGYAGFFIGGRDVALCF